MLIDEKKFIEQYRPFYFSNEIDKELLGAEVRHINSTDEVVENFILNALNDFREGRGIIDKRFIAWKAGRLTRNIVNGKEYCQDVFNGYGKKIEHLDEYIEAINRKENIDDIRQAIEARDVEKAYNKLKDLNIECETGNFGIVYIITVLYFLSGGRYPIYDKFAHIAVKALYFNQNPKDIYVGEAPNKEDKTSKVLAMYGEYCWLLKKLFGKYDISRELDQALWVYGHCTKKYGEENSEDSVGNIFKQ